MDFGESWYNGKLQRELIVVLGMGRYLDGARGVQRH